MSWLELRDAMAHRQAEFGYYGRQAQPMACPECGEPLRKAPPTMTARGVILFCEFDGWHYPQNWRPDEQPPGLDGTRFEVR